MLLVVMSFALSGAVTRSFLELTGYPQNASSELHSSMYCGAAC